MLATEPGRDDVIKVLDFGISKAEGIVRRTHEPMILGTPQFMAPEQAEGRNDDVDHRTDQFALAAIAYTLLAGVEPFAGDSALSVLYQVVHAEAQPLAARVSWPCVEVAAVIARAMSKDMDDRFASVLEFSGSLQRALAQDLEIGPAHRPLRAGVPLPLVRRKPVAMAV
jgi:serine/threonine-protein kinase